MILQELGKSRLQLVSILGLTPNILIVFKPADELLPFDYSWVGVLQVLLDLVDQFIVRHREVPQLFDQLGDLHSLLVLSELLALVMV